MTEPELKNSAWPEANLGIVRSEPYFGQVLQLVESEGHQPGGSYVQVCILTAQTGWEVLLTQHYGPGAEDSVDRKLQLTGARLVAKRRADIILGPLFCEDTRSADAEHNAHNQT